MALETLIITEDGNLAVSPFMALLGEYVRGKVTAQQVKDLSAQSAGVTLTANQELDIDNILTDIDAGADFTAKMSIIVEVRDVFDLAEYGDMSIYSTQQELKDRLGLI